MLVPPAARARAETTLTADGTVTHPGDDTYDPDTGQIVTATPATIWTGRCSLSPPTSQDRTLTAGDDRLIGALVCRLPVGPETCSTTAGHPASIAVGDTLTVDGSPYVVRAIHDRTTMALRRLLVTEIDDAQAVPR